MCEYCEGTSSPISFPIKYTFETGEEQVLQYGFKIEDGKLKMFEKDYDSGACDILFEREIDFCPFCGEKLEKKDNG